MSDRQYHMCKQDPNVDYSWEEYDARGFYLCRVCDKCKDAKLSFYRPEVLSDPNYWIDEPLEEDY